MGITFSIYETHIRQKTQKQGLYGAINNKGVKCPSKTIKAPKRGLKTLRFQ